MSKYINKYNAADLLEQLESKGLTTDKTLSDFIISQQQKKKLPIYLRTLIGIGTFITSLCFISFLKAADIINFHHKEGLIIWGLTFIAGAIGLQKITSQDNTAKHNFLMQSSFASMAVGKTLFVFGIGKVLDSGWSITLGLLIITGITYPIYRMSVDRFLSSFITLHSILINILWDQNISDLRELLLNSFFLLQFISTAILMTNGKIKNNYIPLSYAFAFSLCASVVLLVFHTAVPLHYWKNKELIHSDFINLVLTGGLIALFGWAAGSIKKLKTEPLLWASISAVLLGLISAPGILLTIGLMVLGYAKHEKLLIIVGALLMPIFLWLYYYNLDISLLQKSCTLIGSGILLLAGRFYLTYKGWNKGGASCVQK